MWRIWAEWDKKRFERDLRIFEKKSSTVIDDEAAVSEDVKEASNMNDVHVPKKRSSDQPESPFTPIPKKKKRSKTL